MKIVSFLLMALALLYGDSLKALLTLYQEKSKLSNITKQESAGVLEIIDQERIHMSQARTLKDLFKTISILHYVRTPNNMDIFLFGSGSYLDTSSVRLYINDHDVTSASFGSALLIWGDMPVEFIDHIEIYKGTSSIDFGNEVGVLVIRVYTKLAQREEDQKVRLTKDSRGGESLDYYYAHTLSDSSTLFAYASAFKENAKDRLRDGYRIDGDRKEGTFYLDYRHDLWRMESGYIDKRSDPFLGNGKLYHPIGGGLDAYHGYVHLTRSIEDGKVELSYDRLHYDRTYLDADGTYTSKGYVRDYRIWFEDEIYSIAAKRRFVAGKLSTLIGGFFKIKETESKGRFDAMRSEWSNRLYQSSLYLEERYDLLSTLSFIGSVKLDSYRYEHGNDGLRPTLRVGAIYKEEEWMAKLFASRVFIPPAMYKLYSKEGLPFRGNEGLKFKKVDLVTASLEKSSERWEIFCKTGTHLLKNTLYFDPRFGGCHTSDRGVRTAFMEIGGRYHFSPNDWLRVDMSKNKNSKGNFSPSFKTIMQLYNRHDRWELYNSLIYYGPYTHHYIGGSDRVDGALCYNIAVRYDVSDDLSVGLRGENVLHDGLKWGYRKTKDLYPITDRRFILNVEYRF